MYCLFIVLLLLSNNVFSQNTDACDSRGSIPIQSNKTEFIFSHAYKLCPDPNISPQQQIICNDGNYIRVGIQFPTSESNQSAVTFSTKLSHIGTQNGGGCLASSNTCGKYPCTAVAPILISSVVSRVYVRYNMFPIGTVPFSFLPVDDDGVTCGSPASCTCELSGTNQMIEQGPCTITDPITSPLDTNCGANRDPDSGFSETLNRACNSVCCASCPAQSTPNPSTHKRWAVDPVCTVYQLSGSQWIGHGGFFVDVPNTNGAQQLFVKLGDMSEGAIEIGNVMGIPRIRAFVNRHYNGQSSTFGAGSQVTSGLVVVCDYNPDEKSGALGKVNPFVTLLPPLMYNNYTITDEIFRVPPVNASPGQLGAGTVITQNNWGKNVSMFYIPPEFQSLFASTIQGGYFESQQDVLLEWQSNQGSGFQNAAWWDAYTNVPGWQLNSNGSSPKVPSPCFMSHEINTYADAYATAFSMNGGDAEAAKITAGTPPPWMMPNNDITKPGWWPNVGGTENELWFDISTVLPGSSSAYEIYLDFTQDNVQIDGGALPLLQFLPRSTCIYETVSNEGVFVVFIQNNEMDPASTNNFAVNISVSCTFTYTDGSTSNAMFANNNGKEINLFLPTGVATASTPFEFSSNTAILANQNVSYVICNATAYMATTDDTVESPMITCAIPVVDSDVSMQLNQIVENLQQKDTCGTCNFSCLNDEGRLTTSSCFITVIVLGSIFLLAVIGFIIGCVCISSNKKKEQEIRK